MIIRIWRKPDLFHLRSFRLRLHFLFFLLLIVKEFIIVNDLANRRICLRRNFYQVQLLFLRHFHCFLCRVNANGYIVSNQSYLWNSDVMINAVFCFSAWSESSPVEPSATGSKPSTTASSVW